MITVLIFLLLPSPIHSKCNNANPNVPDGDASCPNNTALANAIDQSGFYEGDIVADDINFLGDGFQTAGVKDKERKWTKNRNGHVIVPMKIYNAGFSSSDITTIKECIKTFEERTCIRFSLNGPWDETYIWFVRGAGVTEPVSKCGLEIIHRHSHCCIYFYRIKISRHVSAVKKCSSSVGKSYWNPFQKLSLGSGCVYKGICQHELLHALGFLHEQSRVDRDSYVRINLYNIPLDKQHNFEKAETARYQDVGEYDYSSVEIGQRQGLSQKDIEKVNEFYECKGNRVVEKKEQCSGIMNNVDLNSGSDFGVAIGASHHSGCCDACKNLIGCQGYSWADGICYFKQKPFSTTSRQGVISAVLNSGESRTSMKPIINRIKTTVPVKTTPVVRTTARPSGHCRPVAPNVDINIGENHGFYDTNNHRNCCQACVDYPGCDGYSWYKGNYPEEMLGIKF